MLMMLPLPLGTCPAEFLARQKRAADELIQIRLNDSSEISSNGFSDVTVTFGSLPPAALTRIVGAQRGLNFFVHLREQSRESWSFAREKLRLAAAICDGFDTGLGLRLVAAEHGTFAPAGARPSAIAPPSTPVAPMTTATLPLSEKISAVFHIYCLLPVSKTAHQRRPTD